MSILQQKKIIVAISGGIAAYKIAFFVRDLVKKGAEVRIVMTPNATKFVSPLTLATLSKNPVHFTLHDKQGNWTNHVELGLWADAFIVAPLTANTLSKMAHGESDNLLLTTYLSARCVVFVAPAMDLDMYKHPSTQENLNILIENNATIIPAESGELASGLMGEGRMAEPETLIHYLEKYFHEKATMLGTKILITAGPTYEPIDPVRFIGNHSSGKMGFEIAKEAYKRGAAVTLITGPTNEKLQGQNINLLKVTTAQQMHDEVFKYYKQSDIAIMSAAVADYRPKEISNIKIKKKEEILTLELIKNPDILKKMGETKDKQYLVGFALETNDEVYHAKEKLNQKNLDAIILNSMQDAGAGFKHNTNKIHIITQSSEDSFELKSKEEVAKDILNFIEKKIKP